MSCYEESQDPFLPLHVIMKFGQQDWSIPDEKTAWYMWKPLHTTKKNISQDFVRNIIYGLESIEKMNCLFLIPEFILPSCCFCNINNGECLWPAGFFKLSSNSAV